MIGIIHYGMGNITSVQNALAFLNIPSLIVETPRQLAEVSHLILPGVGAFPEGMKNLQSLGFIEPIKHVVIENQKPFLGICLGMQLLATTGYENETVPGLNLIPGEVLRLPEGGVRIPHIGWNDVQIVKTNPLVQKTDDVYFVHSFYFKPTDSNAIIAETEYGLKFPAAIQSGKIFGVQFHPEKSQAAGLDILQNFYQVK